MQMINKEKLKSRGWTNESIVIFLGNPKETTNKGEFWDFEIAEKKEKYLSFKTFSTLEDFHMRRKLVTDQLEEQTLAGINLIESFPYIFNTKKTLLKNYQQYDCLKPILHCNEENFQAQMEGSYSLFTDGCFKSIGSKSFSSCAGWILDNHNKVIVAEFTNIVELNHDKKRNMPDFELIGIHEGMKIIKLLGLKNVQCYTDSFDEARMILAALHNLGESRINELYLYDDIIETLKNTNSSISWLPRDYNTHADALTKIPLNAWLDDHKNNIVNMNHFEAHGYSVDRNKEIFFHNNNFIYVEPEKSSDKILIYYQMSNQEFVLLFDKVNDNLKILREQAKNFSYINKKLPKAIQNAKKSKPNGNLIHNLVEVINEMKDIDALTVCLSHQAIAVCKKLTPIDNIYQEEYFELHKAFNDFAGKINITQLDKSLQEKAKIFIENHLFSKEHNVRAKNL